MISCLSAPSKSAAALALPRQLNTIPSKPGAPSAHLLHNWLHWQSQRCPSSFMFINITTLVVDQIYFNPCVLYRDDFGAIREFKGTQYDFGTVEECYDELWLFDCDFAGTLEHPMNAFTGMILFVFIVESIIRLYSFRLKMFASVLDVLDFCIVYASTTSSFGWWLPKVTNSYAKLLQWAASCVSCAWFVWWTKCDARFSSTKCAITKMTSTSISGIHV